MITLQTTVGVLTAKVKKVTLIKTDRTEVPASVTAAWGCSVTTESSPITGIHPILTRTPADHAIYNLQGQRVTNPQKGIYIQNGKKYILK
jgi:hypothetical protein